MDLSPPSIPYADYCEFVLPRIEIPKGLNHQSVGNSVSFRVGREFEKLGLYFAFRLLEQDSVDITCFVVSTNGFSSKQSIFGWVVGGSENEHLSLSVVFLGEWSVSNPSEQNDVTITVEIEYHNIESSSDEPKITWLGVHVDCICCPQNIAHFAHHPSGCGSSSVPDDHSFASDVGLQMGTTNGFDLQLGHPGLGFTYGLDDLSSSPTAWICDNTELQPLPAVSSTSYGTDLDHGILNNGGVSGLLIEPNSSLTRSYLGFEGFESTFHGNVHDLDSSSIAYPFASLGYHESNANRDGCPPLVLDDIDHHSLPSDMFDSYLGLDSTVHSNGCHLGLTSIANPFLSIGYNDSDVGENWPPSVPEDTIHHSLPSDLLPVAECDGFDLGSSSMVHAFDNNDSNFNQFPPSKKARRS